MRKPAIWVSDQGRQNWPVQSQKQARSLKVWILEEQGWDCPFCVAKTKMLISCAVTAHLICAVVFAYVKCLFSHDTAHFNNTKAKYFLPVVSVDELGSC